LTLEHQQESLKGLWYWTGFTRPNAAVPERIDNTYAAERSHFAE
jgi:hypothetical protein